MLNEKCPHCGEEKLRVDIVHDKFSYGDAMFPEKQINIDINLPVHTCSACEFSFLDDEAEQVKHNAVCRALHVMCPNQIENIMKHTVGQPSVKQFADILGLKEDMLAKYMRGALIQPKHIDNLLKAFMYIGCTAWESMTR